MKGNILEQNKWNLPYTIPYLLYSSSLINRYGISLILFYKILSFIGLKSLSPNERQFGKLSVQSNLMNLWLTKRYPVKTDQTGWMHEQIQDFEVQDNLLFSNKVYCFFLISP